MLFLRTKHVYFAKSSILFVYHICVPVGKTSFYLHLDIPALKDRFPNSITTIGADFEPVVKAMIATYQGMKANPEEYSKKAA